MPETIAVMVNGIHIAVPLGSTVAAALLNAGVTAFRRSVRNEARAPLCGMGICYECRVTIDGQGHLRSCMILCANGMDVRTDE
ncbi:MAG: (2Fe-2S)-binding protein [Pyrinomonadaceae bacterium]